MFRILRRLYDWVLTWGDSPYGPTALFCLAIVEAFFFPVPPDVLLIALCISIPGKSFRFGLICTAGSLLGGTAGYFIGKYGYDLIGSRIIEYYGRQELMEKVNILYQKYGFYGVLTAALTPLPYMVFTIASGFFSFSFHKFLIASVIGRSLRFMAVATLIYFFGAPIKKFIDRYFNVLSVAFVSLLILGFLAMNLIK